MFNAKIQTDIHVGLKLNWKSALPLLEIMLEYMAEKKLC